MWTIIIVIILHDYIVEKQQDNPSSLLRVEPAHCQRTR